ncbi:MAG TPA: hypothetical protein VFW00_06115 [Rhodocyclaceae bacterium]|nr:hypothetical protein [Rhodocyclaceae bacterium]
MRFVSAFFLLLLSLSAYASPPLTTDDAGVIDKGGVELDSYYHRQSERQTATVSGLHLQSNAGIGFNTQLGVAVDALRQNDTNFGGRKSSGEYALAGKTRIKPLTDNDYGIAIGYSADRTRAPGNKFRYDNAAAYGVVSVPSDHWLFHANLGWQRSRLAATTATTWGLAAERTSAIGAIDLAVETYGDDHTPAWLKVSARWNVVKNKFFFDTSYAAQLSGTRARLLTFGANLMF